MSSVANTVSDVVGGAVDIVGDVVDGAAAVVEDIAKPVVEAVDSTIQAAINDPIGTAAMIVTAVVAPELLPYVSAANSAAHGASLEQIATSAAISYAGAQTGLEAGSMVDPEYAKLASQSASGATQAALRGTDITQGALSGTINSQFNNAIANEVNGPSSSGGLPSSDQTGQYSENQDYASTQPQAPTDYGFSGNIPGLQATLDTGNDTNPDGSVNYGFSAASSPYTDFTGTGLQPSESANVNKMNGAQGLTGMDSQGTLGSVGMTANGASPNLGDPNSMINNPDTLGEAVAPTDTSNNYWLPKLNLAGALFAKDPKTGRPTGASGVAGAKPQNEQYGSPKLLAGNDLLGDSTGDPYYLQRLHQLYGSLTPDMQAQVDSGSQGALHMAAGGTTTDTSAGADPFPTAKTGITDKSFYGGGTRKVATMAPLQQMKTSIAPMRGMAQGGMSEKYAAAAPAGHKPEFITGITGYYASGKGTGQSDDIPAMLHDGDYVADADLVSALGDGSSKAGAEALEKFRRSVPHQHHAQGGEAVAAKIADGEYVFPASFVTAIGQGDNKAGAKILDKMREAIRAHKRSAPTTKIPPKSKSPLEYLKMAKG